jgi:prevent-host-death family protein
MMAISIAILGVVMDKTCSIAEARNDLSGVVREAEAGRPVTLSRRGKPVAVVLSAAAFAHTLAPQATVGEAIDAFREKHANDRDSTDWMPARNTLATAAHREQLAHAITELRQFRETCHTGKVNLRKMIETGRR